MSISSISSLSSSTYTTSNNNGITQLEKQRINLEKELQKENQSKDDAKTKEQKVKVIQQQIQLIDAQIQQVKAGNTNSSQSVVRQSASANVNNETSKLLDMTNLEKDSSENNNIDVQA